jgi:predicted ABC-type ATPase
MAASEVRYRNQSLLPAQFAALAAAGGKPLTSRLRELIQQLGEAIHESVIESEQIAGVVQDIRKHGFDVLLMLEATIGLNEVSKETEEADAAAEAAGGTFTKNDVNFLRSLRISIEGEDNDELTQGEDETQAG